MSGLLRHLLLACAGLALCRCATPAGSAQSGAVKLDCTPDSFPAERPALIKRAPAPFPPERAKGMCLHVRSLPARALYRKLAIVYLPDFGDADLRFFGLEPNGAWPELGQGNVLEGGAQRTFEFTSDGPDGVPNVIISQAGRELFLVFDASTGRYGSLPTYEQVHGAPQPK